jgi:phosphatidylserine/phosphatidylglycerophosphate/cardiolipin synthase-like enzyme
VRKRRWLVVVLLLAGWFGWHTHRPAGGLGAAALPTVQPEAATGDRLIVEPDAGMQPVYALLASPKRSLDLTIYELSDPTAEALIADDATRGVVVRVVLDHRLEAGHNQAAYDYLASRQVQVRWSSARYFATHEKAFVIDGSTAVVMSLNLTSSYYASSRDVAVVDPDPRDAAAIDAVFVADFAGRPTPTPAADDLVWSPQQSAADLVALIDHARTSIRLESEELNSPPVVDALRAAARRGVAVQIAMTYQADWLPAFRSLVDVGSHISLMYGENPLYIHAKLLIVDAGRPDQRAFVGSENISNASLFHDRELGVVLLQPALVDQLAKLVDSDLSAGRPFD